MTAVGGAKPPEAIDVVSIRPVAVGKNDSAVIEDRSGRVLFFKRNTGSSYRALVTPAERRRRDVANIVASHLMADRFSLPVAPFHEAVLRVGPHHRVTGIVCDYLSGLRPFHEMMHLPIVNRADALLQVLLLVWFGDSDRIETSDNECVDEDGRYIALDFDFCFDAGVSIFGLPKASRRGLTAFATPVEVAQFVERIGALSDGAIAAMVAGVGQEFVQAWTPALARDFTAVLIGNRDALRRTRALAIFDAPPGSWRLRWALFATRHIFTLNIPVKLLSLLRRQGLAATSWTFLRFLAGRPVEPMPDLTALAAEIDRNPTRAADPRDPLSPRSGRH